MEEEITIVPLCGNNMCQLSGLGYPSENFFMCFSLLCVVLTTLWGPTRANLCI